MTDAGFFRGTSSDQDNRFADKQKKLLKELNYSPILATKLVTSKLDIDSLKPWIENKIKEILEKDDEILSELIYEHLAEKEPDGKTMLLSITGFVDDQAKANKFMEDLWNKLVDMQNDSNGVNNKSGPDANEDESGARRSDGKDKYGGDFDEDNSKHSDKDARTPRSSRTPTPPPRSVSKSPTGQKLDERSRGRPRRRLQDDNSPTEESQSHALKDRNSKSRSRSRSHSHDKSPRNRNSRSRSNTRSRSRASDSRSRSRSYSRSSSRSITRSKSRSSSRSPRRRSRSPQSRSYRNRRTRSRSRSREYRPRSRSPRMRRGSYNNRGVYRGSAPFGYPGRQRGGFSSFRRRPSPSWGRPGPRRFSPRSQIRRRRTPSFSPRRRRSPPPYGRSRSRSPHNIGVGRGYSPLSPPRGIHVSRGHMDLMGPRQARPHDMHRPMQPLLRSPARPLMDQRGYNEGSMLSRRSPGPVMGRPDLPSAPQSFLPGPSASSPSSGKKKHKKDKKHRKHKKSKKLHSDSPDRKKRHKKHKKHKKSKKHKS